MKITRQIKIFEYYLYDNPFKKNREYTEIGRLQLSDESTTSELVVGSASGDLYIESDDLLDKLIGINFITEWRTYISGFIVNQLFDRPSLKKGSPGNFPWCENMDECIIVLKMLYNIQSDIYNIAHNICYDNDQKIYFIKRVISKYNYENSKKKGGF